MIRINLLPVKAVQKKEALQGQLAVLALTTIVVIAIAYTLYSTVASKIEEEQRLIAEKEAELIQLRRVTNEVNRFKQLQKELQAKLDVLDKLKEGKTGPVHLLDELSLAVPEKLWLTTFSESGGNVTLQGIGFNEATVAAFLRDLESSPYYRNVELTITTQVSQGGVKMQKFDVICQTETPPKQN